MPYIILSDGCSSSKGTDMGARLLCYLAQQYIRFRSNKTFEPDHKEMGLWIIHNAELVAKQLGLSKNALDATLIIAYKSPEIYGSNNIRVHFYGDGCVLYFGPKQIMFGQIEYTKNAPYYLSYYIDPERDQLFHDLKQDKIIKNVVAGQSPIGVEEIFAYDTPSVFNYPLDDEINGLLIASDGMASFIADRKGLVDPNLYINEFCKFKTTKGEFLKRRVNKLLKNLAKEEIYNADDLSVGAFLLEE
jgi:hypothetical protein